MQKKSLRIFIFLGFLIGSITVKAQPEPQKPVLPNTKKESRDNQKKTILKSLVENMVYIEGGTFTMGATSEQGSDYNNAKPIHQVTLSSFFIGKYEVTQEEWEAVMGNNPSRSKGSKLPVEAVSWNDCRKFIHKLNQLTGKKFRMLTEAEWEYAARGGKRSKGYMYSGGDSIDNVAWYMDNSSNKLHEVGQKTPNELGLYDMSGNVSEWCNDRYDEYNKSHQTNPKGPSSGSTRIERGGSGLGATIWCRVSIRGSHWPSERYYGLGLRLAF